MAAARGAGRRGLSERGPLGGVPPGEEIVPPAWLYLPSVFCAQTSEGRLGYVNIPKRGSPDIYAKQRHVAVFEVIPAKKRLD